MARDLKTERDRNLQYLKDNEGNGELKASSNSKVDIKGRKLSFGLLPHVTCPGRTEFCKECYVTGTYRYKNVPGLLARNTNTLLKLVRSDKKLPMLGQSIPPTLLDGSYNQKTSAMAINLFQMVFKSQAPHIGQFRIHWSGDFFNQDYLEAWKRVARAIPDVKFWVYTRCFRLNFADTPKNLIVFASADKHNHLKAKEFAKKWGFPVAFAGFPDERPGHMKRYAQCMHQIKDKKGKSVVEDCLDCGHCQKGKNVFFHWHR
jgi:hypothetical protein